ncbi:hypothetical protein SAMN05421666_1038 [Roseovarius nanhaiticus]|uniref:Prophage tail length tape measure protein n=1 Tax=Roseovarius nanhaiticus TaxID=573024 RepID=A0A1N7FHE5_9RHOB|nr:hypothetical protein [Roseovarius nanhaiticus]SEK54602.1 hypothetical protein SAMN05216208_1098 [Roseovarius nanhaiticus]SIR99656.1 hypothetical protein SAMN05421666_1038 [Roseovarius nanhaiticus]
MTDTHELRLKIDAAPAKRGASEFTAAIESVKRAVRDLERDSTGAFTTLRKGLQATQAPAGKPAQAVAMTSISTAARQAETQVNTLQRQLNKTGNTAGLSRVDSAYASFRKEMQAGISTAEQLRVAKDRLAQSMHEVREEAKGANEVQRLRTQYQRTQAALDPLTTGTHAYRRAVLAAEQAHRAGAISTTQMNRTLAQAKEAYLGAGAAADNYAAQQARQFGTRAGWGMGMQKGGVRQLGLQLNQIGQVAGMATSMEQALKSASYQAADIGLVFGGMGIAIGAVAGVVLPLLIDRLYDVIPPTKTLKDALSDLDSAIDKARSSAAKTSDFDALKDAYGRVTTEVERLVDVQNRLAQIDAAKALREARDALFDESGGVGWLDSLAGYADNAGGRARRLRDELNLTMQEATALESMFTESKGLTNADALADSYAAMRRHIIDAAGGMQNLTKDQIAVVQSLTQSEDAARRFAATTQQGGDATQRSADSASSLSFTIGTAADEAGRLLANLNSVPGALSIMGKSVGEQISSLQAQNKSLGLQIEGGLSSAAASRRVQLDDMIAKGIERGQPLGVEQIAPRLAEIDALDAAAKKQEALRKRLQKANAPAKKAGGGSRSASISEEAKARDRLNDSIQNQLSSLQQEATAQALLTSNRYQSTEAARLAAEAMAQNAGQIDATTESILRQIDAQAQANEQIRNAPAPLTQVAANSLQQGLKQGLSAALQGDTQNFAAQLSQTVRASIADALATKIVDSLGIDQLFNLGAASAATQMQTAIATGGSIAASQISAAMTGAAATSAASGAASSGGGGLFGWVGSLFGGASVPTAAEGMGPGAPAVSRAMVSPSIFQGAPQYAEGTANTSGIPAILHDNEAVVPLSRGRKIPVDLSGAEGGGDSRSVILNGGVNVTVAEREKGEGDAQFAQRIGEAMQDQLEALIDSKIFSAARYGGALNPRGGR